MRKILVAMPKGVVRDTFFPPETIARLETFGDIRWNDTESQYTPEELRDLLPGVEILVAGWGNTLLTDDVLAKADALKVIAYTGGSVAVLTPFSVFERGICVLSGNDVFAESVAESVIAYALTALRDIPKYSDLMQQGGWKNASSYNEGLIDQPVGLVGFGAVARHTVKMLAPFHTPLKVWADFLTPADEAEWGIKKVTAEEIFSTCKVISLHTSLTPETFHSIDRRLIQMIPDGAVFINTARGRIVDEAALTEELKKQRFKAVLDVYEKEPLPAESGLRGLPNVVLMPHMGGPTIDRRKAVTERLMDDLERFLAGERPQRMEITREAAARMTR